MSLTRLNSVSVSSIQFCFPGTPYLPQSLPQIFFSRQSCLNHQLRGTGGILTGNSCQVIERLAGMRQLVADAENYLTSSREAGRAVSPRSADGPVTSQRAEAEAEDTESLRSGVSRADTEAAFGPLKHSDSLLLISQVRRRI